MYNKRKFNKINDKKVLHKVKKQWVVLSLSMLAMIGAGGAIATQTHASAVNTPQIQEKQVASTQSSSNTKQIAATANAIHNQLMNNAGHKQLTESVNSNKVTSALDKNIPNNSVASKQITNNVANTYHNRIQVEPFNISDTIQHYISRVGDYPQGAFNNMLSNPSNDNSGVRSYGYFNSTQDNVTPVSYKLYNDGLLYLYDGVLPKRTVSFTFNDQSNLKTNPVSDVKIPYIVNSDSMKIPTGDIRAIAFNNVKAPSDSSNLFADMPALGAIDFKGLDTSHVTNMDNMFSWDVLLDQLDHTSDINTSNVITMQQMFLRDSELKSINLSKFDTSKVQNMNYMFANTGLRSLDLSHFNFDQITRYDFTPNTNEASSGLNGMFYDDKSLQSLNLSSLNIINNLDTSYTPEITPSMDSNQANSDNMAYDMFAGDNELQRITIGPNNNLISAWISDVPSYSPNSDTDPQTGYPSSNPLAPKNWIPEYDWINTRTMQTVNFNSDINLPAGTYYRVTNSNSSDKDDNPSDAGAPVDFEFGNQDVSENSSLYISDGYPSNDNQPQAYITNMPSGYAVDPRLAINGSLIFDSTEYMYKVSVDKAGTWGTAHWVLTPNSESPSSKAYGNGNLYVYGGTISGNLPIDKSQINSITFGSNVNLANDASNVFQGFNNLNSFGSGLDTSNATNMSNLFADDPKLSQINFGNSFNTSAVTNMADMFSGDNNLSQINLSPNVILNKSGQNWNSSFFNQNQDMNARNTTSDIKNGKSLNGSFYSTSNPMQLSVHYVLDGNINNPIISSHKISNQNIAGEVSQQSDLPSQYYIDPNNTYTIQHDNSGDYVNVNMDQRQLTLKLSDWMTGKTIATVNDPNVQTGIISDASINAVLPTGYKLADHGDNSDPDSDAHSNDYAPTIMYNGANQTYTIPVVHSNDINYGFWGTARYTLNNNGLMTVSGRPYKVAVYQTQPSASTHRIKLYVDANGQYQSVSSDNHQFTNSSYNGMSYVKLARDSDGQYLAYAPDYSIDNGIQGSASDFPNKEVPFEYVSNGQNAVTYEEKPGKINRFNDFKNNNQFITNLVSNSTLDGSATINPLFSNESKIKGVKFINNVIAPSDCSAFMPYEVDHLNHLTNDYTFNGDNNNGEWLPNQVNLQYVDASGLNTSTVNDDERYIFLNNSDTQVYSDSNIIWNDVSRYNLMTQDPIPISNNGVSDAQTFGGMFGNMPYLKYLNLGGMFYHASDKNTPGTMNMFRGDNSLDVLTIGPNVNLNINTAHYEDNPDENYIGETSSDMPYYNSPFFNSYVNSDGHSCTGKIENGTAPAGTYYRSFPKGNNINIPLKAIDASGNVIANLGTLNNIQLGSKNVGTSVQTKLNTNHYQFLNNDEMNTLNNTSVGSVLNGTDTDGIIYNGYAATDGSTSNDALYVPAKSTTSVQIPIKIVDTNNSTNVLESTQSGNSFTINNQQQLQVPKSIVQDLSNKGYSFDSNNQYNYMLRSSDVNAINNAFIGTPVTLYATKQSFNAHINFVSDGGNTIKKVATHIPVKVGSTADLSKVPTPLGYQVTGGQNITNHSITDTNPINIRLSLKPYNIPYRIQCDGVTITGMSDLHSANQFKLDNSDSISLTNSDNNTLKNDWYQLTASEPKFKLQTSDLNNANQFIDTKKPTLIATRVPVNIPIDYVLSDGTKVGSDNSLSYTWNQTPQIPQYAQSKIPNGYQVTANSTDSGKNNGLNQYFNTNNANVNTRSLNSHLTYYVAPVQKTDKINFVNNDNTLKTITKSGNDVSDSSYVPDTTFTVSQISDASRPQGYYVVNTTQQLSYNGQSDNIQVSPDVMNVPVKFTNNGIPVNIADETSSNRLTVNQSGNITFNNDVSTELHQLGYQLSSNTNNFTITPSDVKADGTFDATHTPKINVTPINFTIPVTYKDTQNSVSDHTTSISNKTINSLLNLNQYANDNLPSGYQLTNSDANILSNWKVADHIQSGSNTTSPVVINMTPKQSSAKVNYIYSNYSSNPINATPIDLGSGNDSATGLNNSHFNIGSTPTGLPDGYQVSNNNQLIDYNNQVQNVNVTPIQKMDTINFVYRDSNGHRHNEGFFTKAGDDSTTGLPTSSFKIGNTPSNLHGGFSVVNPNQSIPFDGQNSHTVNVTPITTTNYIRYMNGNTQIGNEYKVSGYNSNADLGNDTFTINNKHPAGLENGYQVNDADQTISLDNGNTGVHDVPVTPESFKVPFKIVANSDHSKVLDNGTSTNEINVDTTDNVSLNNISNQLHSKGYNLPATTNFNLKHSDITNSNKFNSTDTPVFTASAINFTLPIKFEDTDDSNHLVDGSQSVNGVKVNQQNNIKDTIQTPNDYKLVNNVTNDNLNKYQINLNNIHDGSNTLSPLVIYVQPQTTHDTIKFMYNDTSYGNSKTVYGPEVGNESAFTVNDKINQDDIPNGFNLANGQSNRTLHYQDGTDKVEITPKSNVAHIQYVYGNSDKSNANPSGNDAATKLSNSHFMISSNPINLPEGWKLSNPNQVIYYNGQDQKVAITPKQETDTIIFKNSTGGQVGYSITKQGNDYRTVNGNFKVNTLSAPQGYQIKSNETLPYDGTQHSVIVTPDTNVNVPVQLIDSQTGNVIVSKQNASNTFTVDKPSNIQITNIPKGYQLASSNHYDYTLKGSDVTNNQFNKAPLSFKITPINYTIPLIFDYNNSIDSNPTFNRSTSENVDSQFNLLNYANSVVPENYDIKSGQNLSSWKLINNIPSSGNTINSVVIDIVPKQQKALVTYKNGNIPVNSTPISLGSGDTSTLNLASSKFKIGAHPATLPSGYQIMNSNQVMYYNNRPQVVTVTPIKATNSISYNYNDHNVTSDTSTNSITGNEYVGQTTFDLASLTVPKGYQLSANNSATDAYNNSHLIVNVSPIQASDPIVYKNGSQIVTDTNSTKSIKGNKFIDSALHYHSSPLNFTFNNHKITLPNGYIWNNNADQNVNHSYNDQPIVVNVKKLTKTDNIQYKFNDNIVTADGGTASKTGWIMDSFNTNVLTLPTGYTWANNNQRDQVKSYNGNPITIDVKPIPETDHLIYMNGSNKVGQSTGITGDNYQATLSSNKNFTVGMTPNGLPQGYHVVTANQTINFDGNNHDVAVAPNTEHVTVNFINQNGSKVGSDVIAEPFNTQTSINQLGTDAKGQLQSGYTIKPGQDSTYTFGISQLTKQIQVVGHDVTVPVNFINHANNTQLGTTDNMSTKIGNTINLPTIPSSLDEYVYYGTNPSTYAVTANKFNNSNWQINTPVKINLIHATAIKVPVQFINDGNPVGNQINGLQGYRHHQVNVLDFASNHLIHGYQLVANQKGLNSFTINNDYISPIKVAIQPVQKTDNIQYYDGNQPINGGTTSKTGNESVIPNNFNTSSLVLPTGYKLAGNGINHIYDGNLVKVQVVPKQTTTAIHYKYNDQTVTTATKQGVYNASFDTNSLNLPNGYSLADGNQIVSDNNANVTVNLVPQQKIDTINFVDDRSNISTTHVSGNNSATGLASSHFTVGNTPNGLPSGYQVENPNQVINYDGTNYTIMIKPLVQPSHKSHKSSNNKPNKPINPVTPGSKTNKPASGNSKPSSTSSASTNTSKNNSSASSSASNSNVKPTSSSTNSSASHNASSASTSNPKSNSSASSTNSSSISSTNSSANSTASNSTQSHSNASNASGTNIPKSNGSASSTNSSTSNTSNASSTSTNIPASTSSASTSKNSGSTNSNAQSSSANSSSTSTNTQKDSSSTRSNTSNPIHSSSNTSNTSSSNVPKSNGSATNSSMSMNSSVKPNSTSNRGSNGSASSTATNVPASTSSATPIMPIAPIVQNSSVSPSSVSNTNASNSINNTSVASVSAESNSASEFKSISSNTSKPYKTRTKQGYVIQHNASHSHRDIVTYHGHKHIVHYNSNGKNTIRVREQVTKNGKHMYHYKNIVVSTSLPTNNAPKSMVQAIDMIDFNKPVKHVWSWKSANKVLNQIKVGEVVSHYGTKMARISIPAHYRYFIVNNKALAHLLINKVGNAEKRAIGLKKNLVFHISRIIVLHGKRGNYVRYEFRFNKRNFWVTANINYVKNAYLQTSDVKGGKIRVTRKCCLYTSPKYNKHTFIRSIKPGVKLTVKRVIFLGRKSNYQTRLLLSNGDYITANKQFVKVI